jgi:hypothetical protein
MSKARVAVHISTINSEFASQDLARKVVLAINSGQPDKLKPTSPAIGAETTK